MKTISKAIIVLVLGATLASSEESMDLEKRMECTVVFSTLGSSYNHAGDHKNRDTYKRYMKEAIDKARYIGWSDDQIMRAMQQQMMNAVNKIKSAEYNEAKFERYLTNCIYNAR